MLCRGDIQILPSLRESCNVIYREIQILIPLRESCRGDIQILTSLRESCRGDIQILTSLRESCRGDIQSLTSLRESCSGDIQILKGIPDCPGRDWHDSQFSQRKSILISVSQFLTALSPNLYCDRYIHTHRAVLAWSFRLSDFCRGN